MRVEKNENMGDGITAEKGIEDERDDKIERNRRMHVKGVRYRSGTQ